MKYLRLLGLAVMAAAVVMAVGAATSSATVFCKNNASTETCSEKYSAETAVKVSSEGTLVIETTGGVVINTCASVSVEKTLAELGEEGSSTTTVKGFVKASDIHLIECTRTTDVIEGGEGEVHWISGTDNGTGTANGGATTINTFGASCTYGFGSEMKDWGVLVGGEPPTESVNHVAPKVAGGATCPAELRVTVKLVLTSPKAGYVTSG